MSQFGIHNECKPYTRSYDVLSIQSFVFFELEMVIVIITHSKIRSGCEICVPRDLDLLRKADRLCCILDISTKHLPLLTLVSSILEGTVPE